MFFLSYNKHDGVVNIENMHESMKAREIFKFYKKDYYHDEHFYVNRRASIC